MTRAVHTTKVATLYMAEDELFVYNVYQAPCGELGIN